MASRLDTTTRRRLVAALLALDGVMPGALLSWRSLAGLLGVSHPTLADDRKRPEVVAESAALAAAGLRLAVVGAYRAALLGLARRALDGDAGALSALGAEIERMGLAADVLAGPAVGAGVDDADALAAVGMGPGSMFAGAEAGDVLAGLLAEIGGDGASSPGTVADRCADPWRDVAPDVGGERRAVCGDVSEGGDVAGGTPAGGAAASGVAKPHSDSV